MTSSGRVPPAGVRPAPLTRSSDVARTSKPAEQNAPSPSETFTAAKAVVARPADPLTLELAVALLEKPVDGNDAAVKVAVEVALKASSMSPQLAERIERLRLSKPDLVPNTKPAAHLEAARARALFSLGQQAMASLGETIRATKASPLDAAEKAATSLDPVLAAALRETHTFFNLVPSLLEPALSTTPGLAEAFVLFAPKRGAKPSPLQSALVAAHSDAKTSPATTKALESARQNVITRGLDDGAASAGVPVDQLAAALRSSDSVFVQWLIDRPRPVVFGAHPQLEPLAWAFHELRFPKAQALDSAERFAWERAGQPPTDQILRQGHEYCLDPKVYRQRGIGEVVDDLGPRFQQALDSLGANDTWVNVGARSARAEADFIATRTKETTPHVVSLDVIEPEVVHRVSDKQQYVSGSYIEELPAAKLSGLAKGKTTVADNYAALAYGSEPHHVLRAFAAFPEGTEVFSTLQYENRLFLDRDGTRADLASYLRAVKGFDVVSMIPNGDVYQLVLRRTAEAFEAPVLRLEAQDADGSPPGRRFTWTNDVVTETNFPQPRIATIRTLELVS